MNLKHSSIQKLKAMSMEALGASGAWRKLVERGLVLPQKNGDNRWTPTTLRQVVKFMKRLIALKEQARG